MIGADVNMLSGSVFKGLLRISIPIMIMNVLQSLISVIDMTILGYMVNDDAVGSVGASSTLITFITTLLIGISVGSNVIVAKYIGKNDMEGSQKAVGTSVLFSLVGGTFLLVLGLAFANPLLRLMNCPETLFEDATLYFRLYFLGVPFLMLYNFCASILRATGDSKRPMYILTAGGILKIVLNFVLLYVTDMTVEAVGISTIVSSVFSGSLCFLALVKHDGFIKFKLKHFKFYIEQFKGILFIGVPAGLQSGLYSLANVVIAVAVNGFGPAATKGISIANNFDNVLYQIAVAPSLAAMPYISQNVSHGNASRAQNSFYKAILITVMLGASFGALSAIFSRQLSSLISKDPLVIKYSMQKMVIISSTYFIAGINEIFCAGLRGLGRSILPTIATFVFLFLLRFFWVYVLFPLVPNFTFLYLVWPVGWTLSIFTLFIPLFKSFNKAKQKTLN